MQMQTMHAKTDASVTHECECKVRCGWYNRIKGMCKLVMKMEMEIMNSKAAASIHAGHNCKWKSKSGCKCKSWMHINKAHAAHDCKCKVDSWVVAQKQEQVKSMNWNEIGNHKC